MPDLTLSKHDQWVATLFQTLLKVLASLDWQQEAPDVFLVYVHDNIRGDETADAEVAHQLIDWLRQLGTNIYSDRTGIGNPVIPNTTPADTAKVHDILSSQLGLLPHNEGMRLADRREQVILCGSKLLGQYFSSDYYQHTYCPGVRQAYQMTQAQTNAARAKATISVYVSAQVNKPGFHHVLEGVVKLM